MEGNDCIKFPMGLSKGKVAPKRSLIKNMAQVIIKKGLPSCIGKKISLKATAVWSFLRRRVGHASDQTMASISSKSHVL